eukprot:142800-Pelagomonas_calceolata.AAC.4
MSGIGKEGCALGKRGFKEALYPTYNTCLPSKEARSDSVSKLALGVKGMLLKSTEHVNCRLSRTAFVADDDCVRVLMAVREQLRAILRQVVVHPKMVTDPNLAQGTALLFLCLEVVQLRAWLAVERFDPCPCSIAPLVAPLICSFAPGAGKRCAPRDASSRCRRSENATLARNPCACHLCWFAALSMQLASSELPESQAVHVQDLEPQHVRLVLVNLTPCPCSWQAVGSRDTSRAPLPLQLASSELPEMQAADAELVAAEEAKLVQAGKHAACMPVPYAGDCPLTQYSAQNTKRTEADTCLLGELLLWNGSEQLDTNRAAAPLLVKQPNFHLNLLLAEGGFK